MREYLGGDLSFLRDVNYRQECTVPVEYSIIINSLAYCSYRILSHRRHLMISTVGSTFVPIGAERVPTYVLKGTACVSTILFVLIYFTEL